MAVKTVKNVTLAKVPNFDGSITCCWEQISSIWMESYLVHRISGTVVMLDQSLTSDVPDVNFVVCCTTCYTCPIRVEFDWVNPSIMVLESIDAVFRSNIPKLHGLIFWCRCNKSWIWREFSIKDPVVMGLNGEHEFSISKLENLKHSVVRAW